MNQSYMVENAAILHNVVMIQKFNECYHNYPLCNLALVIIVNFKYY